MFQDLDTTIEGMLNDPAAPAELRNADVSFATPEKGFGTGLGLATLNVFLYEVRENRELRDPVPVIEKVGDLYVQRRPALRIDCEYIVTAWADPSSNTTIKDEHQLLSLAVVWLNQFPIIPPRYWTGSLNNPPQPFAPPTMVAQMNGLKNTGEFWTALGIPPRPYFSLIVTIAMDLSQQVEGPLVTTTISGYRQGRNAASQEERLNIGGTARDKNGNPVANAWVRLIPTGETQVTDEEGRFIFLMVNRGTGYELRARATGFGEAVHSNLEIPSLTGEYNLQFPLLP